MRGGLSRDLKTPLIFFNHSNRQILYLGIALIYIFQTLSEVGGLFTLHFVRACMRVLVCVRVHVPSELPFATDCTVAWSHVS